MKPLSYRQYELSLSSNLDHHELPCQCTTQTSTQLTYIKSQHAILLVHFAECTTVPQWYSGSRLHNLLLQHEIHLSYLLSNFSVTIKLFLQEIE